ncbi:MAG: efflux RND transporter periplasmic adaptor subunit [Phycisphaerales bacterium]|nr:MAG: efflux RND transporter periplasmic adaptor subunit [Phycisphaerales bacterium]
MDRLCKKMVQQTITSKRRTDSKPAVPPKGGAIVQALVSIMIVAIGALVVFAFVKLRKPPRQVEQNDVAPLVRVEQLEVRDIPIVVSGYGTVSPKVQVEIVPEVSGKVVSVNPDLKAGGFIPAGVRLLQIDPRDYELAVQQAKAAVAEAQVRLDTEAAEAEVARKEWVQLHPDTEPTSPLVLREPQIRQARAALESAKAQLAVADLRLERTSLSLPFDALIISEKVDLGQYVVTGQSLGTAYGIDAVEIEVPLEDDELAWFDAFGNSGRFNQGADAPGRTAAKVEADFGGTRHTWGAYVARTTGQVDRTSRMVSVVVEVRDPFEISDGRPPLLPGVFAEVFIEGRTLKAAVAVPRDAIHEGNKVWLVNDGHLRIQPLEIARADKDFAYAISGVEDKAVIVVSSLDTVVEGKKVRTQLDTIVGGGRPEPNAEAKGQSEGN